MGVPNAYGVPRRGPGEPQGLLGPLAPVLDIHRVCWGSQPGSVWVHHLQLYRACRSLKQWEPMGVVSLHLHSNVSFVFIFWSLYKWFLMSFQFVLYVSLFLIIILDSFIQYLSLCQTHSYSVRQCKPWRERSCEIMIYNLWLFWRGPFVNASSVLYCTVLQSVISSFWRHSLSCGSAINAAAHTR